jgi:hypothetical protein
VVVVLLAVYLPPLHGGFATRALDVIALSVVVAFSLLPFGVVEAAKKWRRGSHAASLA